MAWHSPSLWPRLPSWGAGRMEDDDDEAMPGQWAMPMDSSEASGRGEAYVALSEDALLRPDLLPVAVLQQVLAARQIPCGDGGEADKDILVALFRQHITPQPQRPPRSRQRSCSMSAASGAAAEAAAAAAAAAVGGRRPPPPHRQIRYESDGGGGAGAGAMAAAAFAAEEERRRRRLERFGSVAAGVCSTVAT